MSKQSRPGALELQVLKAIWDRQPCTVQDIAELLEKKDGYARTTILTIMQRLHAKGYLRRRKQDGVYRYTAAETRTKIICSLIEHFVDTVLDHSPLPLVAYLAESEELTADEVSQLRTIVQKLEAQSKEAKR